MNQLTRDVLERLHELLANEIDLGEFKGWFVPATWSIDNSVLPMVPEINNALAEFEGDWDGLRRELLRISGTQNIRSLRAVSESSSASTFVSSSTMTLITSDQSLGSPADK